MPPCGTAGAGCNVTRRAEYRRVKPVIHGPTEIEVPADAACGACLRDVRLNAAERTAGELDCPHCKQHAAAVLGTEVCCPGCKRDLVLSASERARNRFTCNRCRREFIVRSTAGVTPVSDVTAKALAAHEAHASTRVAMSSWLGWGGLAVGLVGAAAFGHAGAIPGAALAVGGAVMGQAARTR